MVLQAFAQRYLQPKGLFKKECECLFLLARIIRLLTSGDRVLGRLSLLLDLIKRHHEVYKELYPKCCIPKLHLLYHLVVRSGWFGNPNLPHTLRPHTDPRAWCVPCVGWHAVPSTAATAGGAHTHTRVVRRPSP